MKRAYQVKIHAKLHEQYRGIFTGHCKYVVCKLMHADTLIGSRYYFLSTWVVGESGTALTICRWAGSSPSRDRMVGATCKIRCAEIPNIHCADIAINCSCWV